MNNYRFTLSKINTITGLINDIIDKNNAGVKQVSIMDIKGFVSCMSSLYNADYSTKTNEDENQVHIAIYDGKDMLCAIVYDKEVLPIHKFIKVA